MKKMEKKKTTNYNVYLVVACVLLLRLFVGEIVYVNGRSMVPTLSDGNLVVISKLGKENLAFGDIIVCEIEEDGKKTNLVKRVIGVAGDTIAYNSVYLDGWTEFQLVRNGEEADEPYINEPMTSRGKLDYPLTIPEGQYYVLGDNRNSSIDSRKVKVGLIPREKIRGKVVWRFYPFDSMRTF